MADQLALIRKPYKRGSWSAWCVLGGAQQPILELLPPQGNPGRSRDAPAAVCNQPGLCCVVTEGTTKAILVELRVHSRRIINLCRIRSKEPLSP